MPLAEGYGFKRAFAVLAPLLVHIEQEAGHRAFHQVAVAYRAVAATAARRLCRIGSRTSDLSVFGIAVGLLRHTHRNCAEGCAPRGGTMPGMASRLCEALAPHAEKIAGSADRQSVRYVPSTWRSWLALANVDPNVTDRVFSAIGPATVSRPQIRTLGQDSDSSGGRLALIIAVLVWGRGTANGRMRDAIVRALHHQDRDQVLKRTAELAQRGAVAGAYEAWTLPGLRAPFFTKWLWAASALTPQSCCLIQDKRVWNSLWALGWDSLQASGRRDWPSRYAAYVVDVHECAREIAKGVSGEDIEYTLFRINGRLDDV